MKKLLSIIIAFIMVVGLSMFAGCGGSEEDADTITVGVANNSNEINIINSFRTAYLKKFPEKKIKIVRITGDYDNALVKYMRSDMPDIIQVYDFSAEYWTSKNLYYPISDYMQRDGINQNDYFDSVIDMTKSGGDGKIYWAARDYNKVVVSINTAMFETAGIQLPEDSWKWSDFMDICRQLNEKRNLIMSSVGQEIFYPVFAELNWEAVYYPAIKSYGGDILDKEAGTALKNLSGIQQGLNKLLELADLNYAVDPTLTGSPFQSQQSAMAFCVRPNIVSYVNSLKDESGNPTIDFVSLPAFDDVGTSFIGMGSTGYAISGQCRAEKREDAWQFLKFIMTNDGQEAFSTSGAGIPVIKSMAEDKNATFRQYIPGANHDAFIQYQERDLPMNYLSGYNPDKHLGIRSVLLDELLKNLFSANNRTAYYSMLKEKIESYM